MRRKFVGGSREAIPEIGGEKPIRISEEILITAKAAARRFGRFWPMLFVDGSKRKIYTPLPFGETNYERVSIMTQAGMDIARSRDIGEVVRVIFVCEAWVSPARQQFTPHSQDPDRMEVLLFNVFDAQTNAQYLEMYSCVKLVVGLVVPIAVLSLGSGYYQKI